MNDNRKRVLIVATTAYMIRQFNMNNIHLLIDMGFTVEVACNFIKGNPMNAETLSSFIDHLKDVGVIIHHIDVVKSMFAVRRNFCAYRCLQRIIKVNKYKFIHSQTPVASVLARIAGYMNHVPVIYMAHGFHFYQGAGPVNWMVYYPVEKCLSRLTEALIVINEEDYQLAREKMRPRFLYYIPGVGIKTDDYGFYSSNQTGSLSRESIGIPEQSSLIFSVGELSKRKNHEFLLRVLARIPNAYLAIAGTGELMDYLQQLAVELGVAERVIFLGFRRDLKDIYPLADVYCHPAYQEGLSVAIMEAMASGLPVVCSDIRGNRDLIIDQQGGYLFPADNIEQCISAINHVLVNKQSGALMGEYNKARIKGFDSSIVNEKMAMIYRTVEMSS